MSFIELHEGCPPGGKVVTGCLGPIGNYYTVFNTELKYLMPHFIFSLIFGVLVFLILGNNKTKIKLYVKIIISFVLIFFLLVYFFPNIVEY